MTGLLTRRWQVMTTLSSAGFSVRNLGRSVTGQVPITDAWVELDTSGRPVGVRASLDLASIGTGNTRRDRDLAKPHLLSTGRFPTLTFTGTTVEGADDTWDLHGRLDARGTQIDVVLSGRVHQAGEELHVGGTTSFDRRDLGIRAPRLMIGRRIDVSIEAVLRPV